MNDIVICPCVCMGVDNEGRTSETKHAGVLERPPGANNPLTVFVERRHDPARPRVDVLEGDAAFAIPDEGGPPTVIRRESLRTERDFERAVEQAMEAITNKYRGAWFNLLYKKWALKDLIDAVERASPPPELLRRLRDMLERMMGDLDKSYPHPRFYKDSH